MDRVSAKSPKNTEKNFLLGTEPDSCPVCNHTGVMQYMGGACFRYHNHIDGPHKEVPQLTYRCPRQLCGALFLAEFERARDGFWNVERLYPSNPPPPEVPACISDISPNFKEIYLQAQQAKHHGLTGVYGMALRKAFEFLIKDHCISKSPDDEKTIKEMYLGNVINNRIDNANIKTCAVRAAWLGNDETHYERRFTGHDVEDLSTLIKLTLNWIENEHLTQVYLDTMQKNAK